MSLQDLATAQGRYDAQEPPDEVECRFCDGGREVIVVRVQGGYQDVVDWPEDLEYPLAPCPQSLPFGRIGRAADLDGPIGLAYPLDLRRLLFHRLAEAVDLRQQYGAG